MNRPLDLRPLSREKLKIYADLGSRSGRERRERFVLEGPRAIEDALERGHAFEALVVSDAGRALVAAWSEKGKVPLDLPLHRASEAELASIADTETPQGVIAVGRLPPRGLAALPDAPSRSVTLLADGVQDPGNLGTLLRTLVALGGTASICCKGTVDPFNPKALRGAAGYSLELSLAVGIEPGAAVGWCRERELPIVSLVAGAPDVFRADLPEGPIALAVGNETIGLSGEVTAAADHSVGLPMVGGVESLSAAVAGSIAMYVLVHGRTIGRRR